MNTTRSSQKKQNERPGRTAKRCLDLHWKGNDAKSTGRKRNLALSREKQWSLGTQNTLSLSGPKFEFHIMGSGNKKNTFLSSGVTRLEFQNMGFWNINSLLSIGGIRFEFPNMDLWQKNIRGSIMNKTVWEGIISNFDAGYARGVKSDENISFVSPIVETHISFLFEQIPIAERNCKKW